MGSISRAEMAAAQVIVTVLWAATLATCVPQGGLLSVLQATPSLNQNQEVVSQVVGALQPSIARAVAEELAGASIEGPTARPVYNFQFKVADDGEQTYISQEEAREGDKLSGTYSYVDADGALVTVNYEAGAMGYSETRDKQEGFVQMRAR